jgi:hypothetical protein
VGYSPNQKLNTVFTIGGSLGNKTRLQALNFKGGSTLDGAKEILLRAAVAALLDSTSVNYPLTTQQVINAVNAALASNNRSTILALATQLDTYNNYGCPLN